LISLGEGGGEEGSRPLPPLLRRSGPAEKQQGNKESMGTTLVVWTAGATMDREGKEKDLGASCDEPLACTPGPDTWANMTESIINPPQMLL
jgi:hypothetical protein